MKKLYTLLIGFIIFMISGSSVFAAQCDQTFYGTLRHGKTYTFGDSFSNSTSNTKFGISNVNVSYVEQKDYNGSTSFPVFSWTNWFKNKGYILNPGESGQVIEANTAYPIIYHPATRNYNNLLVKYTASYFTSVNGGGYTGPKTHTECKYYEISWCGDGVRDTGYGETCDPADPNQTGWGTGGCDPVQCKPVEAEPTCNSLTANPLSGIAPTTSNVTCTGFNVDTYKIDCGNGQVFTGNGNSSGTQSFARACSYTKAGTYTPTCTINGTITNNSCKKTVKITNPTPSINIIKTDLNTIDQDGTVENDTQTINVGQDARFKIKVTNDGPEALRNIVLTDAIEASCAGSVTLPGTYPSTWADFKFLGAGNHSNSTLEPGESFQYTCKKTNVRSNLTNTAAVSGIGVISGTSVQDNDPTVVIVNTPNPSIIIDKVDANADDQDASTGNDTQTVLKGEKAVFKIRVTNNGEENLKDIVLTDAIEPNCAGSVTLPSTKPSTWAGFATGGAGNHSDGLLQPGEWFEYTCEKLNTQSNYTNTAGVDATGADSGTSVDATDPTVVVMKTLDPSIIIDKVDANADDQDGSTGNDTQTVSTGNKAVFKIRVTNNGEEALTDIVLTDAIEPNCAGSVTLPSTKPSTWSSFTTGGAGNHSDGLLQPGEWFEYTCEKLNTQNSYTNTAEVDATGVDSGTSVASTDPTDVVMVGVFDLALVKVLSSTTPGPFAVGDTVTFNIVVTNQGTIDATNVEITDYIPAALTLADTAWTTPTVPGPSLTFPPEPARTTRTITSLPAGQSVTLPITFTINSDASGSIINYAEISEDNGDDCDSTADNDDTNDGTPVNDDIGDGCNPGGDEDDHDPETIVLGEFDLALVKVLSTATPGPFNIGDTVTFDVVVTNQGTVDAADVEITDYIPTGLTLADTAWTQSGSTATRTIASLTAGNSVTLPITFTINADAGSSVTNYAEISEDNGDDCDSTADGDNTNDGTPVNDDIGDGCNPGGDEDDHDPETIPVGVVPVCTGLTTSPSTGVSSLTSTVVCTGENVTSFKIDCGNGTQVFTGAGTNNGTEEFSRSCSYTSVGTYTPTCYVNDTITSNTCEKTVTVTNPSSSSSSGGGTVPICYDIIQDGSTVTCVGNSKAKSAMLICGTGENETKLFKNTTKNGATGRMEATFTCAEEVAECRIHDKANRTVDDGTIAWIASNQCKTNLNPFCGDGNVDPGEQCDTGSSNGTNSCTASCKIKTTGGSGSGGGSSSGGSVLTFPNGGQIVFGPAENIVIGHGKNALAEMTKPYIFNNSDYDLSFDQLCVKKTKSDSDAGTDALGGDITCMDIGYDTLYPYERIEIETGYEFKGNKNGIPAGSSYGSATLTTTIKDDGNLYDWAYFAADTNVRVSKPSIATTGGGTSFVKDTSNIANVTSVAFTNKEDNKNFVGSSVSDGDLSSYTTEVTDTSTVEQVEDTTAISESVVQIQETVTATNLAAAIGLDSSYIESYNGLENVYIVEGRDLEISSISSTLAGPRTYIVQGGDLVINGNIDYSDNIAFVVKGGDIKIASNVTQITGTYITIPNSNGGGYISSGYSDSNVLTVKGSLYGNISNLVNNRTYISNDTTTGQINVGTIVSFGSGVFQKPAPLVGQFISEYLSSDKVAQ